jgi:hypothetical protein
MKSQSAVEFLSTYGFMLSILGVTIVIVIFLASSSVSLLPSKCTAFAGPSCNFVSVYSNAYAGYSLVTLSVTNSQSVPINLTGASFIVGGTAAQGFCAPQLVYPGQGATCVANLMRTYPVGSAVQGSYILSAVYCNLGISSVSKGGCSNSASVPANSLAQYGGSLSTVVVQQQQVLFSTAAAVGPPNFQGAQSGMSGLASFTTNNAPTIPLNFTIMQNGDWVSVVNPTNGVSYAFNTINIAGNLYSGLNAIPFPQSVSSLNTYGIACSYPFNTVISLASTVIYISANSPASVVAVADNSIEVFYKPASLSTGWSNVFGGSAWGLTGATVTGPTNTPSLGQGLYYVEVLWENTCGAGLQEFSLASSGIASKTLYSVVASASPPAGGTVTGSGSSYTYSSPATVSETPNPGYTLASWSCTGSAAPVCPSGTGTTSFSFTVTASSSVTAIYSQSTYAVTASASPTAGGTVTGSGSSYTYNSIATVSETPNSGYVFTGWTCSGDASSACPSGAGTTQFSFTVTTGATVTALYSPTYAVTAYANPSAGGTVTGSGIYTPGSTATVSETPNPGYALTGWTCTGDAASACPSGTGTTQFSFTLTTAATVIANFGKIYFVPITLTNSQTSPTTSGFQQMLSIPSNTYSSYINSGWNNVEFTSGNSMGASGSVPLYAWVASNAVNTATNTIVWVNLGSSTIPANSGTLTIYMNILPSNVMTSNAAYTGEAPQLSGTYGQYDNGANVFLSYADFKSGLSPWYANIGSANNGFSASLSGGGYYAEPGENALFTSGVGYLYIASFSDMALLCWDASGSCAFSGQALGAGTYSLADPGGSPAIFILDSIGRAFSITVYWGAVAAYPPGGVMPTSSLGGVTTSAPYSLTMTPGSGGTVSPSSGNYLTGNTVTITATPNTGFAFTGWTGTGTGSYTGLSNPANIVMNGNIGETASFGQISYVPITLTNSQTSPTTSGFQQMLSIPSNTYSSYINSGWTNVEFTATQPIGTSGNVPLYAWVESNAVNSATNTVVWVNLGSSTIPANSGTLTIYMNFMPSNVMTSNTAYTGEAPQLYGGSYAQTSYAQYDNGAQVFGFYDNFPSCSLSATNWASSGTMGISVSNGLTLTESGSTWGIITSVSTFGSSTLLEFYGQSYTQGSSSGSYCDANFGYGNAAGTYTSSLAASGYSGCGGAPSAMVLENFQGSAAFSSITTDNTAGVWGIAYDGATSRLYKGYTQLTTSSTDEPTYPLSLSYSVSSHSGYAFFAQYARERIYPPGGTMPSASFNGVISGSTAYSFSATAGVNGAVTCAYSSNSVPIPSCSGNFLIGTQITLTAVPNSGFTAFWTGTGTGSYSGFANPINVMIYGPTTEAASFNQAYYVPVTLTNSQTSPTASGFQQMLNIPSNSYSSYINSGWSNVEFTSGNPIGLSGNVPLYAWVESNAVNTATNTLVWVNLGSSTIPANSGTLTIYMNFLPSSNVMTSNAAYTGEAPQISGTYAQYDNGASVFSFYDDFPSGETLSTKWTVSGSAYSVSNGLTLTTGSGWTYLQSLSTYNPETYLFDFYGYYTHLSNTFPWKMNGWQSSSIGGQLAVIGEASSSTYYQLDYAGTQVSLGTASLSSPSTFSTWSSATSAFGSINYGTAVGNSASFSPLTSQYVSLAEYGGDTGNDYVQYARVRLQPPGGVVPSASFGSVA